MRHTARFVCSPAAVVASSCCTVKRARRGHRSGCHTWPGARTAIQLVHGACVKALRLLLESPAVPRLVCSTTAVGRHGEMLPGDISGRENELLGCRSTCVQEERQSFSLRLFGARLVMVQRHTRCHSL